MQFSGTYLYKIQTNLLIQIFLKHSLSHIIILSSLSRNEAV